MATAPLARSVPPPRAPSLPPPTPELLAIVGGLFVAAVGALLAISYAGSPSVQSLLPSAWGVALGVGGIITGLGIVLCVMAIHRRPARHLVGGALIMFLSIVSVVVTSGGLVIGFVLAFIGGLWLFVWSPPASAPAADATLVWPTG